MSMVREGWDRFKLTAGGRLSPSLLRSLERVYYTGALAVFQAIMDSGKKGEKELTSAMDEEFEVITAALHRLMR